jgi:hypothetical protein
VKSWFQSLLSNGSSCTYRYAPVAAARAEREAKSEAALRANQAGLYQLNPVDP